MADTRTLREIVAELPPNIGYDIWTVIQDLDKIRTAKNRDTVIWAQTVLSACGELAGAAMKELYHAPTA